MFAFKLIPTEIAGIKQVEGTLIVGQDRFTMFADNNQKVLRILLETYGKATA